MKEPRTTLKSVSEIIRQLDGIEPLQVYEAPTRENEYEVNEALARIFGDASFRKYLKNNINKQVVRTAINSETEKEHWMNLGRTLMLKELYRNAERAYHNISLKKKPEPLHAESVVV